MNLKNFFRYFFKNAEISSSQKQIGNKFIFFIILLFGFLLYGNTLQKKFGYVLDDGYIIADNQFVQKGFKGIADILSFDTMAGKFGKEAEFVEGGRYRPASVITFAIEWYFFSYGIYLPQYKYEQILKKNNLGFNAFLIKPLVGKKFKDKGAFEKEISTYLGGKKAKQHINEIYKYTINAYGNPQISHLINILLYCISAFLIYIILSKLLIDPTTKNANPKWIFSIPFITALLWLAHPVHTEVVANIKGRDEIMALLGGLYALFFTIKFIETNRKYNLILIFISFFIGIASKENAITFLSIIPFSLLFFNKNFEMLKINSLSHNLKQLKNLIIPLLPSILAAALFLFIRYRVIGFNINFTSAELMNNSFAEATTSERYGTIFYTFIVYLRLLFFPHPLTYDYYPYHIPLIGFFDIRSLFPLILHIALLVYAIVHLFHQNGKNNMYAYGIWFYFSGLSVVSNLPFSLGTFMAERFLFLPSIGFSIICAYFLLKTLPVWLEKYKVSSMKIYPQFIKWLLFVVISLYTGKTIIRNTVWTDNFTLFTNDIKYCPNSAKGHTTAGEQFMERGRIEKNPALRRSYLDTSIKYFERALEIYPKYIAARLNLGIAYDERYRDYKKAIYYYLSAIELKNDCEKAFYNINVTFNRVKDFEFEFKVYNQLYKINPNRFDVLYRLGTLYGGYKKNNDKAISYFLKAVQLEPNNPEGLTDLGIAFAINGQYDKAISYLERASQINPDNPFIYRNLMITYQNLGKTKKADYYSMMQQKAYQRLKQRRSRIKGVK